MQTCEFDVFYYTQKMTCSSVFCKMSEMTLNKNDLRLKTLEHPRQQEMQQADSQLENPIVAPPGHPFFSLILPAEVLLCLTYVTKADPKDLFSRIRHDRCRPNTVSRRFSHSQSAEGNDWFGGVAKLENV